MSSPVTRGVSRHDRDGVRVTRRDVVLPAAAPLTAAEHERINRAVAAALADVRRADAGRVARAAMIERLRNGWRNPER